MAPKKAPDLKVTKKDEADYYKEASSWDADRIADLQKSKKAAWFVASAGLGLSFVLGIALAGLTPLKHVEPFLVRVDTSTGVVDQVVKLKDASETYDEAMTKYFLGRVVSCHANYTRAQLQNNYDECVLFTAPSARPQLKSEFAFENPNGPYKRYGENGLASIKILNKSFIAKNVAQVRYVLFETTSGKQIASRWMATIEFRYVSAPASEDARGVNPLGFQVTNYRKDPEADAQVEVKQ